MKNKNFEYITSDGEKKTISVIPVPVSLEGLDDKQIEILAELSKASNYMTPIFARQRNQNTLKWFMDLLNKKGINSQFIDIISHSGSPYDYYSKTPLGLGKILGIPDEFKGNGLYPEDITQEEFEKIPEKDRLKKHTIVIRDVNGKLKVYPISTFFNSDIVPMIKHLKNALEMAKDDEALKKNIESTIKFIQSENLENMESHLRNWFSNTSKIDIRFDTSEEEGVDEQFGVRGFARGGVYIVNEKHNSLNEKLKGLVKEFDEKAPWSIKAKKIDVPNIRFVNILNCSGGFSAFPLCTLAQNLPNEKNLREKYGTISIMYSNISNALKENELPYMIESFLDVNLTKANQIRSNLEVELLMTSLHEIGHGCSSNTYEDKDSPFTPEDDTIIEEARAEVFSMWGLKYLETKGETSAAEKESGYYLMLSTMIKALTTPPKAHNGSRNLMFHYLLDHGGIEENNGRFKINVEKVDSSLDEFLGRISDIRSYGRVGEFEEMKKKYIRTNRREEFVKKMEKIPSGRIMLFPNIVKTNNGYELQYPKHYREQQNSLIHFV